MNSPATAAEQITRGSNSNLAFGFFALPAERRRDISVFYAFCRVVDDIADDSAQPVEERRAALEMWRQSVAAPSVGEPELAAPVRDLIARHRIPVEHLYEIISGMEMDLEGTRYETFADLSVYCHRVASVVGLVSIEIFGYRDPACRQYAVELGMALQLTNIVRDVGQDYATRGRVYLPRIEMDRFGYDVAALAAARHNAAFAALMQFQAERAFDFYARAEAALPASERRTMIAAEIMRTIYKKLLGRMQRNGFHVFTRRYRLNRLEKAISVARVLLATRVK